MRISILSFVAALGLLSAVPAELHAQTPRPGRPDRGVFANPDPRPSADASGRTTDQLLTVSTNLAGGFDTNALAAARGVDQPTVVTPGGTASGFTQATASLAYSFNRTRFQFSAGYAGSVAYYPALETDPVISQRLNTSSNLQITHSLTLRGGQSHSSQPFYSPLMSTVPQVFAPPPTQQVVPDPTAGVVVDNNQSNQGTLGLTQTLSRRLTLALDYHYRNNHSNSHDRDLTTHSGTGMVRVSLRKDLGLHVGYTTELGHVSTAGNSRNQHVNFGLDFDRALSLTRKTSFTFGTGLAATSYADSTRYHLLADANLMRELGRSWGAGLAYKRTVEYMETFQVPVFSDALSVEVSGLITRRLRANANLGAARGHVGSSSSDRFTTTFEGAGLTLALMRSVAIGVNYNHYGYDIDNHVSTLPGLAHQMSRQGLRVSVSLWAPIIQHTRRADAPR